MPIGIRIQTRDGSELTLYYNNAEFYYLVEGADRNTKFDPLDDLIGKINLYRIIYVKQNNEWYEINVSNFLELI